MIAYKSTATREKYISACATPRFSAKSPSTFTKSQYRFNLIIRGMEIKIANAKDYYL